MKKTYTYDEVFAASLEYFKGDQFAAEVFTGKYALRDLSGNLLESSPVDVHKRLAKEFARIESKYPNPISESEIYDHLSSWRIIAQGGSMSGIGNQHQMQSLSNCFVIDSPHDSYGGILKTDQEQVQIMKRRGGVGFDLSTIRPKGLPTTNAARTTDGIGVFMERFSNTCREVAQNGRRGALMLSISVHHKEIRTFINIKRNAKKITGANISIRLSDEFMNAVKEGGKVHLRFPVESSLDPITEEYVDAKDLWNDIISAAHERAEPGLLFWDTILRRSPADIYSEFGFKTISTNPCGELPLGRYGTCRLLLMNPYKFVKHPFCPTSSFDFVSYEKAVKVGQKLLDDLVDLELEAINKIIEKINSDPEPENVKKVEKDLWEKVKLTATNGRRTGLGVTALGDTLAALGIRYGSKEAVKMTGKIYKSHALGSYRSSVKMAEDRGTFPIYDYELEHNHEYIQQIMNEDPILKSKYKIFGRRNIANLTTPPAGTISILSQTTSGCEPVFLLAYDRFRKLMDCDKNARVDRVDAKGDKWQKYRIYHHGFKEWMNITGKSEADIEESPYWKSTASDIDCMAKINMQAAAQIWIDHSISNTTNIPNDAPVELVSKIYMKGWETGCKGITVYREGSRDPVMSKIDDEKTVNENSQIDENHAPKRPKNLKCDIHRASVKGEQYVVLVGLLNGKPYEIFAGLSEHIEIPRKSKNGILIKNGKVDGIATYNLNIPIGDDDELLLKNIVEIFDNPVHGALSRSISLSLRHGVPIQYVVEQLRKDKGSDITSFNRVIARILSKAYISDGTSAVTFEKKCQNVLDSGQICESTNLSYQSGCVTCMNCGHSKCG